MGGSTICKKIRSCPGGSEGGEQGPVESSCAPRYHQGIMGFETNDFMISEQSENHHHIFGDWTGKKYIYKYL